MKSNEQFWQKLEVTERHSAKTSKRCRKWGTRHSLHGLNENSISPHSVFIARSAFSREYSFDAATPISSICSMCFSSLRAKSCSRVVVLSGVTAYPDTSEILSQCLPCIPLLHSTCITGSRSRKVVISARSFSAVRAGPVSFLSFSCLAILSAPRHIAFVSSEITSESRDSKSPRHHFSSLLNHLCAVPHSSSYLMADLQLSRQGMCAHASSLPNEKGRFHNSGWEQWACHARLLRGFDHIQLRPL
jgi:hypothetical protein